MFTGIIKAKGAIVGNNHGKNGFVVSSPIFKTNTLATGASVAIDGVCLTISQIIDREAGTLGFDLGAETIKVTTLGQKRPADLVNIEPALAAGEALDGHVVQGHVDGLAKITEIQHVQGNIIITFAMAPELCPLIVKKGSVAVNGVSLTVNEVSDQTFSVCLIPHTLEHTCFGQNLVDDLVHIETDIMGRYLLHMMQKSYLLPKENHL